MKYDVLELLRKSENINAKFLIRRTSSVIRAINHALNTSILMKKHWFQRRKTVFKQFKTVEQNEVRVDNLAQSRTVQNKIYTDDGDSEF